MAKITKSDLIAKLEGLSYERLTTSLANPAVKPEIKKLVERELDERANRGTRFGYGEVR